MADYLTLLARRSLGLAETVRPAFVHRYADGAPSAGEPPGRTAADDLPAAPPTLSAGDGRSSVEVRAPARETGPVRSSSPTAPAVERDPSKRDAPTGPKGGAGSEARVQSGRSEGEPRRRSQRRDQAAPTGSEGLEKREPPELLLPTRPDRTAVDRTAESHASAESSAAGGRLADIEGGRPPSRERSGDRTPDPVDRPFEIDDAATIAGEGRVTIAIGTVEVRAVTQAPPTAGSRPQRVSPKLGLDDYLAQRGRGER